MSAPKLTFQLAFFCLMLLIGCKNRSDSSLSSTSNCPDVRSVDCKLEEKINAEIPKMIEVLSNKGVKLVRNRRVGMDHIEKPIFLYNPSSKKVSAIGQLDAVSNLYLFDVDARRRGYGGLSMLTIPKKAEYFDPGDLSFVLMPGNYKNEAVAVLIGATDNRTMEHDYGTPWRDPYFWFFDLNNRIEIRGYERVWWSDVPQVELTGGGESEVDFSTQNRCGCFLNDDLRSYDRWEFNDKPEFNYSSLERCREALSQDRSCSMTTYTRF